ncbi:hypothetical protein NDU88_007389 [Pleurodeles waltl]|uniref:Uncharacterized protein n=1 Tax=Pleurodeles waltl TaxID=8319 RepID=A0AAV7SSC7_PLEWA|nr:hypothetical protein NDU88_007389 [Pleurodeles waltl]
MDNITCLRQHVSKENQEEETHKGRQPETDNAAGRQEEHEHQGRDDGKGRQEERECRGQEDAVFLPQGEEKPSG